MENKSKFIEISEITFNDDYWNNKEDDLWTEKMIQENKDLDEEIL